LRFGPPQLLLSAPNVEFTRRPDGQVVLTADDRETIQIVDLELGDVQALGTHPQAHATAVSPDGRWGASAGWHSDRVRLWNVPAAKMVHEWVVGVRNLVFFTPDSRHLIISRDDEFSFWDVESLEPVRTIRRDVALYPSWVSFSPDARLMALEMAPGVIHLREVATARTVARLEDPQGDAAREMYFTPDGTWLVVIASSAGAVHIWDLRAIRIRLKGMGLDWEWPEFPPVPSAEPPPTFLEITVVRE
jgi:WD40 repeat protein